MNWGLNWGVSHSSDRQTTEAKSQQQPNYTDLGDFDAEFFLTPFSQY